MAASTIDRFSLSNRDNQVFSDFLTDLTPHPVSKDVLRFVNENAVSRAIRNLILTDKRERLYQPTIGSNIRKMLFEPMGESTAQLISTFIQTTITDHEPRARVLSVIAEPDYDNNAYFITINFMVINKQDPVTINITLI